jgi:CHAD domain-containing protein
MAFRIRPNESMAHGLRRLAKKELASAREGLRRSKGPDKSAIHEARKSVKKVRAIADVVKDDDGHGLSGAMKGLRGVNRVLSAARDADAMNETLSKLLERQPRLLSEHTVARLRRLLSRHNHAVAQSADRADAWRDAADELRDLRSDVKRWSPAHRRFGALAPGLRATHKRGRKAMARALESQRDTDFHEWRKQIKALWYELRLIEDAGPTIQRAVKALDEAESSLGDDHNIVVLRAHVSAIHSLAHDSVELQGFWRNAQQVQQRLRRKAIASAEAIYSTAPRVFMRQVRAEWKYWNRQNRASHSAARSRKASVAFSR